MDLGPEEIFLRFSELSRNRALMSFAHFCVQPAAPGLNYEILIENNRVKHGTKKPEKY